MRILIAVNVSFSQLESVVLHCGEVALHDVMPLSKKSRRDPGTGDVKAPPY